jgi:hypothetical protein
LLPAVAFLAAACKPKPERGGITNELHESNRSQLEGKLFIASRVAEGKFSDHPDI